MLFFLPNESGWGDLEGGRRFGEVKLENVFKQYSNGFYIFKRPSPMGVFIQIDTQIGPKWGCLNNRICLITKERYVLKYPDFIKNP